MSFGAEMEAAFRSVFGDPTEPEPTQEPEQVLPDSYTVSSEPLFQPDDPRIIDVCTLAVGDRFIAMFSGEYELLRHDGIRTYARHIATGVEQALGNRAPVLKSQR